MLLAFTPARPDGIHVWSLSTYGTPGCHSIETFGDGPDRVVPFTSDLTVVFS